jgi:hypothetical protein
MNGPRKGAKLTETFRVTKPGICCQSNKGIEDEGLVGMPGVQSYSTR